MANGAGEKLGRNSDVGPGTRRRDRRRTVSGSGARRKPRTVQRITERQKCKSGTISVGCRIFEKSNGGASIPPDFTQFQPGSNDCPNLQSARRVSATDMSRSTADRGPEDSL